jgi:hypothetical protein
MKIKVTETKTDYIEKEIDITFPFYYTIDISEYNDDDEKLDDIKTIFGRVNEEGEMVEIIEMYLSDDTEIYTLKNNFIDLNDIIDTKLNDMLTNKEFISDEIEFNEAKERFIEQVNGKLGGGFIIGSN